MNDVTFVNKLAAAAPAKATRGSASEPPHLGQAAMAFAGRGIPVLPIHTPVKGASGSACSCDGADCRSPGKHPRTTRGLRDATTDVAIIRGWWERWPDANVGVLTGAASGLVALDIDPRNGGDETLRRLERAHGPLPPTWRFLTGGGGQHVLFRHPGGSVRNSAGRVGPGVDVKADGGYIVAPPSLHASGRWYEFSAKFHPDRLKLADMPDWLLKAVDRPVTRSATPVEGWRQLVGQGVTQGERNDAIARFTGHLLRIGVDPHVTMEKMLVWNRSRCRPPLPDTEVEATVRSIARCEIRRRRGGHV